MHTHARDWDYTYHTLKDGTRQRYRVHRGKLKVKHVCGGQQHYGFKCRQPEYVRDKVLFPRVWIKLCEALSNPELLLAGLKSQLFELENSEEIEELKRIEQRLEKLYQRELSYAEQRADGSISKSVHHELMIRLGDERKELIQAQRQLENKATLINEARQQVATAQQLVEKLPDALPTVSRETKNGLSWHSFHE